MTDVSTATPSRRHPGTIAEVFSEFLRLGLTSFGGPVAHLGYFRETFVARRAWLDDRAYADLVALCQFLPGPASSQVGMALGWRRAGLGGLLAAWFAFTLPSAIVLVAFAFGVSAFGDALGSGWLAGLKAAAVAVVASAVMGMAKNLTPDAKRATIAGIAMILVLLVPNPLIQIAGIVIGGILGLIWVRDPSDDPSASAVARPTPASSRRARAFGMGSLIAFAVLLVGLPVLSAATGDGFTRLVDIFYRAGALVFGGGHVVLPLLEAETVPSGLVDHDTFLAGYGAAQAVPGPLFTFASFLGASTSSGPSGLLGAAIALLAIFLPAALLLLGVLPFWDGLRRWLPARRALLGINAAVVGILAAAFYDPVITQGVTGPATLAVAVAVFLIQKWWKVPAWAAIIGAGILGFFVL